MPRSSCHDAPVAAALNRILELELAAVVRHAQDALMLQGQLRLPLVAWMEDQAREALASALEAGEQVTSLGALPSLRIAQLVDTRRHAVEQILRQATEHRQAILDTWADVLERVEGRSVRLEASARRCILGEEQHLADLDRLRRRPGRLERVR